MLWFTSSIVDFLFHYKNYFLYWIIFNTIAALYIKSTLSVYYRKKKGVVVIDGLEQEVDNVHDVYPEFSRKDNEMSFLWMLFAFCTFAWLRIFLWVGLLGLSALQAK